MSTGTLHATAPARVSPEAPALRGWARPQARVVDALKRAALVQLHATPAGERLLLRMYLAGEEATELTLRDEQLHGAPAWLQRQVAQHLAEEETHSQRFSQALVARGGVPQRGQRPDAISRRKIRQWRDLAARHAPHFAHGALVSAFAIGLCAEQMAQRVLVRHRAVLDARHPGHPMRPLIDGVLADEARHVRLCAHTLQRLVAPHEQARLDALLAEARAIDRAFGISTALAMLGAGLGLRLLHRP